MSSAIWSPLCSDLNMLRIYYVSLQWYYRFLFWLRKCLLGVDGFVFWGLFTFLTNKGVNGINKTLMPGTCCYVLRSISLNMIILCNFWGACQHQFSPGSSQVKAILSKLYIILTPNFVKFVLFHTEWDPGSENALNKEELGNGKNWGMAAIWNGLGNGFRNPVISSCELDVVYFDVICRNSFTKSTGIYDFWQLTIRPAEI